MDVARVGAVRRDVHTWLPALAWLGTLVLAGSVALLTYATRGADDPRSPTLLFVPLFIGMILSFTTMGALLANRRRHNIVGWILMAAGLSIALSLAIQSYLRYLVGLDRSLAGLQAIAMVVPLAFQLGLVLSGIVVLFFPDGHLQSRGRLALGAILAGLLVSEAGTLVDSHALDDIQLANPLAVPDLRVFSDLFQAIGNVVLVLGFALAAALILRRFRRSTGDERKQLTWFAYVAVFLAVALAVASAQVGGISDIAWFFAFAGFAALPIAIAIAITKYRLYEIDRLVNRTLVYIPLVGIVGGIYAAATVILQKAFVGLTGQQSDGAVVLSTLIAATAFTPVRKALEAAVERRFRTAPIRGGRGVPVVAGAGVAPATAAIGAIADGEVGALLADDRFVARVEEIARRVARDAAAATPPAP